MFKYLWAVAIGILYLIWAVHSIRDIIESLRLNTDFEPFTQWFIALHLAVPIGVSFMMWLCS